jgi:two-component system chemotaxis family response regulator WspR
MMGSEQYLLATSGRLASLRPELEAANDELRRLSNTDGLTGVTNRREFDIALSMAWSEAALDRHKIALLMLDVDHFKKFNDVFGHAAGDSCLRAVAEGLQSALAGSGYTLARYGGEEFAVILPGAGTDIAHMVAENLRQVVAGLDLAAAAPTLLQNAGRVTISIGLASETPIRAGSGRPLVDGADAALYLAKKSGRNCVRAAEDVEAMPRPEAVNDRPAS